MDFLHLFAALCMEYCVARCLMLLSVWSGALTEKRISEKEKRTKFCPEEPALDLLYIYFKMTENFHLIILIY